ncbi:MAG: hypothetical protein KF859_10705 [Phycisphaeraceae bacterium]|nr:hypothetical protein [Phycisphaeraceae bacterium]
MTTRAGTPNQWRQRLGELLRPLDVESGLLFCNHVLAACRNEKCAPVVAQIRQEIGPPCSPFMVHLAARAVLRHGLGPTTRGMGTEDFKRLVGLLWDMLDQDPAMQDPGWAASDPTGWAIRFVGLQQSVIDTHLQNYGLAAALFTNALPRSADEPVDVASDVQARLAMPPDLFMRLGFIAGSVRMASHANVKLRGTITTDCVMHWAAKLGNGVGESWPRFCELAASSPGAFRQKCIADSRAAADERYDLYRLNLLRTHPLIETAEGRYVAPDPELVYARTTLGMYYDALTTGGTKFTQGFGPRFSNLVGDLLRAGCGDGRVWSESGLAQPVRNAPPSKNADHVILDNTAHVLVECKALRPSAQLLMLGDPKDTDGIADRIVGAVDQMARHAKAIGEGKWAQHRLPARDCFGIVVTYGGIPTANGLLFRGKVRERGMAGDRMSLPYLVLSLSELDSLLRLVENGHEPHDIMRKLCGEESGGFPGSYQHVLSSDAISSRTRERGQAFLDSLPGSDSEVDR